MDDLFRQDIIELGHGLARTIKEVGPIYFFAGKVAWKKYFPEFVDHLLDRGIKMDRFITDVGKTGVIGHGFLHYHG